MRKRKMMKKKMSMEPMTCAGITRKFAWTLVAITFVIVAFSPVFYS